MGLTPTLGFDGPTSGGCVFTTFVAILDSPLLSLDLGIADWAGVCLEPLLLPVL